MERKNGGNRAAGQKESWLLVGRGEAIGQWIQDLLHDRAAYRVRVELRATRAVENLAVLQVDHLPKHLQQIRLDRKRATTAALEGSGR